ncbi:MAG: DMT family transporter [Chloroflexota bacterium]
MSSTTTTYGKSSRLVGSLAALGAVSIWGLTFVPTKIAMMEMGALTLSVLRFALALLIMAALAWRLYPNAHNLRNVSWGTLALLGFTSVTLFFGFQNLGLARTSATEAGMLSASVPALTAVLAALVYKERVGGLRLIGIVASVVGVVVVVLVGSGSESGGSLEGNLLVLAGTVSWAFYTLLNKDIGGKMPEVLLLAYTMLFGIIFLLPGMAVEIVLVGFGPITPVGLLSVLFLGIMASGASFFLWNTALRHLDASEASTYINLVPVINIVAANLMLGETLIPAQLFGGALVIFGVYLASR